MSLGGFRGLRGYRGFRGFKGVRGVRGFRVWGLGFSVSTQKMPKGMDTSLVLR